MQAFDADLDIGSFCQRILITKTCVGLGFSVKSAEAKWLQTQLAAMEVGVKIQQLLSSLDESKPASSNVDLLAKIFSALKQLRLMASKEESMRSKITFPAEGESQEMPPELAMYLVGKRFLITYYLVVGCCSATFKLVDY